jgi:hypothetical protein
MVLIRDEVAAKGDNHSQKWHTMHFCQDALGSHFCIGIGFDGREAMWIWQDGS